MYIPTMTLFANADLAVLADDLAGLYVSRVGAAALDPTAEFEDDVLSFSFRQGLAESEALLRGDGRLVELRELRERRLEPLGAHLVPPIEEFARSPVAFHVGLFDPGAAATTMLFGFEAPRPRDAGDGSPLVAWSLKVRGEARRLRRESVEARVATVRIREEFRAERAMRAERFLDED
jgi:hypothetical protein